MTYRVPLFDLNFDDAEAAAVRGVLDEKWISMGPRTAELEARFAHMVGAPHAVAVTNCTAALHLAMVLLGVGPDDEVIVPSLSFVATAAAVRYVGAEPVFADILGPHELTISPRDVVASITPRTKAIVAMHYGGFPCQMDRLKQIADEHGVALIEDAAHAPSAACGGAKAGTIGDVGCFSFFANKNISTGEGGMLVMRDENLAQRARLLRSHGMTTPSYDRARGHATSYDVVELGYNYRLDDVRAAIGLAQLDKMPGDIQRRAAVRERYIRGLGDMEGVTIPFQDCEGEGSHYIFPVVLDAGNRDDVRVALAEYGIQTSVHYPAIHRFAAFKRWSRKLPTTEYVADRVVTLPMYANLPDGDVDFVCRTLADAIG